MAILGIFTQLVYSFLDEQVRYITAIYDMCGIVGYIHFKGDDISDQVLDRYVDSLVHRGPGSRGVWRNKKMALSFGHRRLAIFDLSDMGRQPMTYLNGRYTITFNGEIYNFHELKEELSALGYKFRSTCDTEVILAAYAQWGEDCLMRFNGAWAFGIWDDVKKVLFLARDHFGIKPFHYVLTDRYFAFASEMKAFLQLPEFSLKFDEAIVGETIANVNGLEGTEHTLLQGVKRLPGGYCMTVAPTGKVRIRQWWSTYDQMPKDIPKTEEEQIEHFRSLLHDSCHLRLRSDLPIVATLSGGLDSSSVASMTASILREEGSQGHFERVYTASFPGTNQEETQYARDVAAYYNLPLTVREINFPQDLRNLVDKIIWHHEDIYWVLAVGPWLVYEDIVRGKGAGMVVLDGSGGDELAVGHYFMLYDEMQSAIVTGKWSRVRELQEILVKMRGGSVDDIPINTGYVMRRALLNSRFGQNMLLPSLSKLTNIPPRSFLRHQPVKDKLFYQYQFKKPDNYSALQHTQYIWTHFMGMQTVNRMYDRAPAANTISLRAPLLDYRLVTYSMALPDRMKVSRGYTKYILRQAVKGLMPEHVRLRTNKVGFTSPMNEWFAGPLNGWLKETINDQDFQASSIWNGPAIKKYVTQSMAERKWDNVSKLWPIFNAFHTMRIFHQGGLKEKV